MFDFIVDEKFRDILERDFKELEIIHNQKASKSVLVMTGSLIETVLLEYFTNNVPKGHSINSILKLDFHDLIELSFEEKLISKKTKDLSIVIKDYRNLIHSGREIRTKEKFDFETASVAFSLLKIIINEIKSNYSNLYGYTSSDLIQKILNDDLSINIFDELIQKLNQSEKLKLFNKICNQDINLKFKPQYLEKIRTYIPKESIKVKLEHLTLSIKTGKTNEVIYYYSLFHSDLDLLDEDTVNLITTYILSYLQKERDLSEISKIVQLKLLTSIGKYIKTEKNEQLLIDALKDFYFYKRQNLDISELYYQVINSLDENKKNRVENKISECIDEYIGWELEHIFTDRHSLPF